MQGAEDEKLVDSLNHLMRPDHLVQINISNHLRTGEEVAVNH